MLVNNSNGNHHVEFISYSGSYPNLCSGILHLRIDGEDAFFGYSFNIRDVKDEEEKKLCESSTLYDPFWSSGGSCGFMNDYSEDYVNSGEWIIDRFVIPEQFKKYAEEIDEVFNDNVELGCCGGCL